MKARNIKVLSLVTLVISIGFGACGSEDSDEDTSAAATAEIIEPGSLLITLDTAMGSVGFTGQEGASLALADADWVTAHCKETGSGVKDEFQGQADVEWGCKFAVATDGPDTPRGGLQRVKSIACSLDKAISAGEFSFNGTAYDVSVVFEPECWGTSFSEMIKEELPDLINADGYVEGTIGFTGYQDIPETITTDTTWEQALLIDWGRVTGEEFTYTMLMSMSDTLVAATILESEGDRQSVFGMSLTFEQDAADTATFRYVGRFVYGPWGDGSGNGSRHVRTLLTGPYTGDGTFSSITAGSGFEIEDYGNGSGGVSIFEANSDGLMTKDYSVGTDGTVNNSTDTWNGAAGTTAPTGISYLGNADQLKAFLSPNFDESYTSSSDWFKANGPFAFESITISGD